MAKYDVTVTLTARQALALASAARYIAPAVSGDWHTRLMGAETRIHHALNEAGWTLTGRERGSQRQWRRVLPSDTNSNASKASTS